MAGIRLAKQAAVKELGKYVEEVIAALGKREALVTDETIVADLLELGENPHRVKRGDRESRESLFGGSDVETS